MFLTGYQIEITQRSKDLLESVRDNHIFDCIPDSIFK